MRAPRPTQAPVQRSPEALPAERLAAAQGLMRSLARLDSASYFPPPSFDVVLCAAREGAPHQVADASLCPSKVWGGWYAPQPPSSLEAYAELAQAVLRKSEGGAVPVWWVPLGKESYLLKNDVAERTPVHRAFDVMLLLYLSAYDLFKADFMKHFFAQKVEDVVANRVGNNEKVEPEEIAAASSFLRALRLVGSTLTLGFPPSDNHLPHLSWTSWVCGRWVVVEKPDGMKRELFLPVLFDLAQQVRGDVSSPQKPSSTPFWKSERLGRFSREPAVAFFYYIPPLQHVLFALHEIFSEALRQRGLAEKSEKITQRIGEVCRFLEYFCKTYPHEELVATLREAVKILRRLQGKNLVFLRSRVAQPVTHYARFYLNLATLPAIAVEEFLTVLGLQNPKQELREIRLGERFLRDSMGAVEAPAEVISAFSSALEDVNTQLHALAANLRAAEHSLLWGSRLSTPRIHLGPLLFAGGIAGSSAQRQRML